MKTILTILICFLTVTAHAEMYNGAEVEKFLGTYVRSYEAGSSFIKTLPAGIPLICSRNCSVNKTIIVYVFRNESGEERWLWSMDSDDAMFHKEKYAIEKESRVVMYDKTFQKHVIYSKFMDNERETHSQIVNAPEFDYDKSVATVERDLKQIEYEKKHPPKPVTTKGIAKAFEQGPPPEPKPLAEIDSREQSVRQRQSEAKQKRKKIQNRPILLRDE